MKRDFQRIIKRIRGTSRSLNDMALQLESIAGKLKQTKLKDLRVGIVMDGETVTVIDIKNNRTERKVSFYMEATVEGVKTTLYRAEKDEDIKPAKSITTSTTHVMDMLTRELRIIKEH